MSRRITVATILFYSVGMGGSEFAGKAFIND